MRKDCRAQKSSHHKKFEKAEKAIDGNEDDLVLCSLMSESKKESKKKKLWFTEDVKQPLEAVMLCTINNDTFFCSQRIPGLETQEYNAIQSTMTLASMTSPTSMCPSKIALVLCLLSRKTRAKSRYGKLMELNRFIHFGLL